MNHLASIVYSPLDDGGKVQELLEKLIKIAWELQFRNLYVHKKITKNMPITKALYHTWI